MFRIIPVLAVSLFLLIPAQARAVECLDCHAALSANIVADWRQSKHSEADIGCADCHGSDHLKSNDFDKVAFPTPDTCGQCHDERAAQYKRGKHAFAWAALKAMPTTHAMPMVLADGMKGCGGCHKIG
ncbi:MAG: cytochrome c3 family protein, partial [Alphaproteobacteria bacterium]|nr:cytochrome c3 family protein [Alphaproteobacteria bacterium]